MDHFKGQKGGYAGVALYSKIKPISVKKGLCMQEHDSEGRVITAEYAQFYVIGVCKYDFMSYDFTNLS